MTEKEISKACEEYARNYDRRLFFKKPIANAYCIKVLFEAISVISPVHSKVYNKIKNKIWPDWKERIGHGRRGFIEIFEKLGMVPIDKPIPGSFVFFKKKNLICHVGLNAGNDEFWHIGRKGFVRGRLEDRRIVYIGSFDE